MVDVLSTCPGFSKCSKIESGWFWSDGDPFGYSYIVSYLILIHWASGVG